MKKIVYFILFLILNFGSLALGSWLMNGESTGTWYANLNKAPWTPPGWVFGVAWSTIMFCFSWYLTELFSNRASKFLWLLYTFQVVLNVSWNWIFFNQHFISVGFFTILILTMVLLYYFITFRNDKLKYAKYLLVPYIIWLCIATSLNGYIFFNN